MIIEIEHVYDYLKAGYTLRMAKDNLEKDWCEQVITQPKKEFFTLNNGYEILHLILEK